MALGLLFSLAIKDELVTERWMVGVGCWAVVFWFIIFLCGIILCFMDSYVKMCNHYLE